MKRLLTLTALFLAGTQLLSAQETQFFRADAGVAKKGHSLPVKFGKEQTVWSTPLPDGHSTGCVVNGKIFLTGYMPKTRQLATYCLDAATGRIRWSRPAPAKRIEPFHRAGSPAASSPASNGKHVFVFFGSYGLICYDLDGNEKWTKPMGPFQDEFGASSSPVLADGLVILNEDHDVDCHLIAIDQKNGRTVWRTERPGFTRSYSTPVIWKSDEGLQVVVAGSLQLAGYDVKTGEKRWWVNGLSRIVDTTPVIDKGTIYVATWTPGGDTTERIAMGPFSDALKKYDKDGDGRIAHKELPKGAVLSRFFRIDLDQDKKLDESEWKKHARVFELAQNVAIAIKPGGRGDRTKSQIKWVNRRGLPTVPSPVVYRNILYMVKDSGVITALDAETGKALKRGRARGGGNYYASAVAGDGKIYLISEDGVLTVLKAGADWSVISSHRFDSRIVATPVILDNRILIRTEKALHCFATKKGAGRP